jgi:Amt family ammonium transporter
MEDGATISWLITAAALVMLMTPGVGFFYGGLVRRKNFISMIILSFIAFSIITVQWTLIGYSLVFGPDVAGVIGSPIYAGLNGVSLDSGPGGYPPLLFMLFQMTFAAVTVAIVISGIAERIKLTSFILLAVLWTTLIYDPLAHWVWGGGWLASLGCIDFAGGIVVHISAGFAALALSLVIGKRSGFGVYSMDPHNRPMTLLGAGLLWFGWFGFNGGSALAANGIAVNAIVTTMISAAAGSLVWLVMDWRSQRPSSIGIVTGGVAGLGAITPAAGYVSPLTGFAIGIVAGVLCYYAMNWRMRSQVDESLDAWSIHGVGGLWGTIAVGIFAISAVNGYSGLIQGNPDLLVSQLIGALAGVVYVFGGTYFLAWAIDRTIGLRVTEEEEYVGLDLSQHGERA